MESKKCFVDYHGYRHVIWPWQMQRKGYSDVSISSVIQKEILNIKQVLEWGNELFQERIDIYKNILNNTISLLQRHIEIHLIESNNYLQLHFNTVYRLLSNVFK